MVYNCVTLGIPLSIPQEKLKEISQCSLEEQTRKIVRAWFECDPNPTYGTLRKALSHYEVERKSGMIAQYRLMEVLSKYMCVCEFKFKFLGKLTFCFVALCQRLVCFCVCLLLYFLLLFIA